MARTRRVLADAGRFSEAPGGIDLLQRVHLTQHTDLLAKVTRYRRMFNWQVWERCQSSYTENENERKCIFKLILATKAFSNMSKTTPSAIMTDL